MIQTSWRRRKRTTFLNHSILLVGTALLLSCQYSNASFHILTASTPRSSAFFNPIDATKKKTKNYIMVLSATTATATIATLVDDDEQQQENTMIPNSKPLDKNDNDETATLVLSKKAAEHAAKQAVWRQVSQDFCQQSLHPCYLHHPLRGSMIEAATEYPQGLVPENNNNDNNAEEDHSDATVQQRPPPSGISSLMMGTHKHLGGALDPTDGCIYGVPANARAILCLYPSSNNDKNNNDNDNESGIKQHQIKAIPLPADSPVTDMRFKWLRGIFAHGYLWAIPAWASAVLCVDVDAYWKRRRRTSSSRPAAPSSGNNQNDDDDDNDNDNSLDGIVQYLPLPSNHPPGMTWQWHGAGLNQQKTAIFCIPSNAHHVLKVDLETKATSFIPITVDVEQYPSFQLDLSNKWYGGILGQDNCVYGIPYRSCAVLKIDCDADTATLVGRDYGCSGYNWHGGIQVAGKIYAHPSHAPDTVLVIDTNDKNQTICSELPIQRATYDVDARKNYKWLGGAIGADGNIYCPPCDTSAILKINPTTNTCTTFGFTGTTKNKWQGGILSRRDGCIYCIPASGRHILRIATFCDDDTENNNPIQLLGNLSKHKDKWQGGHVGLDGCLYFIPENGYRVLKVTPPNDIPVLVNGQLPKGDVKIELL